MLFALFGVMAFAQKDLGALPTGNAQSPSPAFKCIDRHASSAAQAALSAEGELVTPPASAQVEKWYTADGKFMVNTLAGLQDFTSLMSASMVRR